MIRHSYTRLPTLKKGWGKVNYLFVLDCFCSIILQLNQCCSSNCCSHHSGLDNFSGHAYVGLTCLLLVSKSIEGKLWCGAQSFFFLGGRLSGARLRVFVFGLSFLFCYCSLFVFDCRSQIVGFSRSLGSYNSPVATPYFQDWRNLMRKTLEPYSN